MNLNQVTLPATDLERSVDFYRRMGFKQIVGSPDYARFECPAGDSTFSVHRVASSVADTQVVVYFETPEVDAEVRRLQAAGFEFTQLPRDEPWLWREARLADPSGNVLCLFRAGEIRKSPPWRLEDRESMKIVRSREFRAEHAWDALDIAKMNGITTRLHWTDRPYRWHVNDGAEVFAVLDGQVAMHYREGGEERSVLLEAGDVFFAGVGCEHVAHPQGEARILVIEHEGSA